MGEKCYFGDAMSRCFSDTGEMARFQRTTAGYCNRTDSELLDDIQRQCQLVSPRERSECVHDLEQFRGTRACCNYGLQRRAQQASNVLSNPNPNPNPSRRRRRRGTGLLRPLILLFLLRGFTRRRRRRFL